jgi:hypothetical protein
MNSIESAKGKIREVIAASKVPEDPGHADNTLAWLFKLDPKTDPAMQIAALAHDIDRAVEARKVRRFDFDDYDVFKAAHAQNGAKILREILDDCQVAKDITDEACRLVTLHEIGGDSRSDLLKDVDSISYFDVNMPLYFQREGWDETKRRCVWGYRRLSSQGKEIVKGITYEKQALTRLLNEAIGQAEGKHVLE